jgi:DUF1680 family protein
MDTIRALILNLASRELEHAQRQLEALAQVASMTGDPETAEAVDRAWSELSTMRLAWIGDHCPDDDDDEEGDESPFAVGD